MAEELKSHSKLNNSAIGSWAGYIYQGLCAVYVVVNMIRQDNTDKYKDYVFYLDAYEDFSIHDENGKIVSLHQCKDKKSGGDYKEAIEQMREQKKRFDDLGKCNTDTKMYFHCNTKPKNLGNDIEMYKYHEGEETCQSEELINKIRALVTLFIQEKNLTKPADRICNSLFRLVDEQVMTIHQQSMTSKEPLYEMSKKPDCALKFSKVYEIIYSDAVADYGADEFASLIKLQFILSLKDNMEERDDTNDWNNIDRTHIEYLADFVANIKASDFLEFCQRIQPANPVKKDVSTLKNCTNKSKTDKLLETVGKATKQQNPSCDWSEKGKSETPVVFDNDSAIRICRAIYGNRSNLNSLFEYDWFVSDISESVKDMRVVLNTITSIQAELSKSIFEPKVRGILDINDFNNEDYD